MNVIAKIAFSTVVLVCTSLPAFAMNTSTVPGGGGGGTPTVPGGDGGCQIDCDDNPPTPGEPFVPFEGCMLNCDSAEIPDPHEDCMINCDADSTIPDPKKPGQPDVPRVAIQLAGGCGDKLGYLRDVTVAQIEAVGPDDVIDVVPVCRNKTLADEQDEVAELRPAIGLNPVTDAGLQKEGFNPEDVVGVIVDNKSVTFYVHQL
jgi:hypothetical protein